MTIMIRLAPEKVTLEFESTKAPCPTCQFHRRDLDSDGEVTRCGKVDRGITAEVLLLCEKENWRRDK